MVDFSIWEVEMRLEGRSAIITGSSKGLGRAMAIAMAKEGADIVVNGRDVEAMEETGAEIEALGRRAIIAKGDIRKIDQVREMVEKAVSEFGKVDILVNNAGGALFTPVFFEELTEEDWDKVVDTNLRAVFLCCREVWKYMKEMRYGKIVNVSSLSGRMHGAQLSGVHYSSAKAGLGGLTRQLAYEFGPFGVTVNAVAPGLFMSTQRVRDLWNSRDEEFKKEFLKSVPLRKVGEPKELAPAVVFLASDDSSYITGATIDVNGGRYMC